MINHKLTLIAFFLSYLIVTTFCNDTALIPYKELTPHFKIVNAGSNKLTAHITWEPNGIPDDQKLTGRFRCQPKNVLKVHDDHQHKIVGDRNATFHLTVKKNNALVSCKYGLFGGLVGFSKSAIFTTPKSPK